MRVLTTPDERFAKLPDYPFAPHHAEIPDLDGGTLRMHYVDEGPRDADPVVFIHGNPSWSHLWRKMIPPVAAAGNRVIAVDLIGLGRSDKPTRMQDFTVARHVEGTRSALIDVLRLSDITFVLHDWGGIVGLRILHHHPGRVARVCLTNSGMFLRDPAEPMPEPAEPTGPFAAFQKMVRETPDWPHWEMLRALCVTDLPQEVVDAYHAPYPDPRYLCGNRQFTQLLATTPDDPQLADNWEAWQTVRRFDRPMLTIFSDRDQVARGGERRFIAEAPGCKGQPHAILEGGSHFPQEDVPDAWLAHFMPWLDATRRAEPAGSKRHAGVGLPGRPSRTEVWTSCNVPAAWVSTTERTGSDRRTARRRHAGGAGRRGGGALGCVTACARRPACGGSSRSSR